MSLSDERDYSSVTGGQSHCREPPAVALPTGAGGTPEEYTTVQGRRSPAVALNSTGVLGRKPNKGVLSQATEKAHVDNFLKCELSF